MNSPKIRLFQLPFYDDILLLQAEKKGRFLRYILDNQESGNPRPLFPLDGSSNLIHALNERRKPKLEDPKNRKNYLAFFAEAISGDEGPFKILDQEEINLSNKKGEEPTTKSLPILQEIEEEKEEKDSWKLKGAVFYGDALFEATFRLERDGTVEMLDDNPILGDLPVTPDRYPWRPLDLLDTDRNVEQGGVEAIQTWRFWDSKRKVPSVGELRRLELGFASRNLYLPAAEALGRLGDRVGERLGVRWAKKRVEARFVDIFQRGRFATLDLSGFECGVLEDDDGNGWGLKGGVWLHAPGIKCGRVAVAPTVVGPPKKSPTRKEEFGQSPPAPKEELARGERSAEQSGTGSPSAPHRLGRRGAEVRKAWLAHQFRWQLGDRAGASSPSAFRAFLDRLYTTEEEDLVPQTYDHFATAHIRQGEERHGHAILVEKKDREHTAGFLNRMRNLLFAGTGKSKDSPKGRWRRLVWATLGAVVLVLLLLVRGDADGSMGLSQWAAERASQINDFVVEHGGQLVTYERTAEAEEPENERVVRFWLKDVLGIGKTLGVDSMLLDPALLFRLVLGGVILFALLPFLIAGALILFKWGFRYGLSPGHAIGTFIIFLIIGWGGVHIARTGGLISEPDWKSTIVRQDGKDVLDEEIALVLNVASEAETFEAKNQLSVPIAPTGGRIPGTTLYADATPCNIGVNSLLYAADLFIPLIDLDQRERCTIRSDPEHPFEDYSGWRFLRALYEALGWIVTSLLILTVSGIMRRDLER